MKTSKYFFGAFLIILTFAGSAWAAPGGSLLPKAEGVLLAFKNKDGAALAKLVHPVAGVRFTPYAWDELQGDRTLKTAEVATMFAATKKLKWGSYDGSGDPILLTPAAYVKRFVWNTDYTKVLEREELPLPDLLKKNYSFMMEGPAGEQVLALYPNARVVAFYYPGKTGPEGGAMDWSRLLLVFTPHGNDWFLAGVVHDEWTI